MDSRKAISPILATVILIAVTLVIAIGVIGWIMGVWGSIGGPSENLVVTGGYTKCSGGNKLEISFTVINKGTAEAKITRVEVPGFGHTDTGITCDSGSTIKAGGTASCSVEVSSSTSATCMVGASYDVRVYTEAGNVYLTRVSVSEITQT